MIVNQDIKPEKQAYYIGSLILAALKESSSEKIELLDVFENINQHEKVTYHAFTMAMNWLYLIEAIELNDKNLTQCF